MDTTNSITFTSKLTFWDKFKCFYLLHLYSLISLYNVKKWQRILGHLIYIFICIIVAITLFSDADLGSKLFVIFCFLSFFWIPAITSFKVARNIPNNLQLILTPGNATETSNTPSLKVLYSDTRIDRFKNAILFDTTNFYILLLVLQTKAFPVQSQCLNLMTLSIEVLCVLLSIQLFLVIYCRRFSRFALHLR